MASGEPARQFNECNNSTLNIWSRIRQPIAETKAQPDGWNADADRCRFRENPRYIVPLLSASIRPGGQP